MIGEKYVDGATYSTSTTTAFADNRLYFSGWDTIAFFDVKTEKVGGLETINDALDALIPNTHRANFNKEVMPTEIVGNTENIIIYYVEYNEDHSDDTYVLYYAIERDKLLGVICYAIKQEGVTITTFNGDLKKLCDYDLSELSMRSVPVRWQNSNYCAS